jgi:hypothetical protein
MSMSYGSPWTLVWHMARSANSLTFMTTAANFSHVHSLSLLESMLGIISSGTNCVSSLFWQISPSAPFRLGVR